MKQRHLGLQAGLGMIGAIVILVTLASLAAAITHLSWSQQSNSADDLMGEHALQAANAGAEWGMFQALKGSWQGAACNGSQSTLDLSATIRGFKVTVSCSARTAAFREGQETDAAMSASDTLVWVYHINAVGCNGTTAACTDDASATSVSHYVERARQAIVTSADPGS